MNVQPPKLQGLPHRFLSSELASLKWCLIELVPAMQSVDVGFDFVRC